MTKNLLNWKAEIFQEDFEVEITRRGLFDSQQYFKVVHLLYVCYFVIYPVYTCNHWELRPWMALSDQHRHCTDFQTNLSSHSHGRDACRHFTIGAAVSARSFHGFYGIVSNDLADDAASLSTQLSTYEPTVDSYQSNATATINGPVVFSVVFSALMPSCLQSDSYSWEKIV